MTDGRGGLRARPRCRGARRRHESTRAASVLSAHRVRSELTGQHTQLRVLGSARADSRCARPREPGGSGGVPRAVPFRTSLAMLAARSAMADPAADGGPTKASLLAHSSALVRPPTRRSAGGALYARRWCSVVCSVGLVPSPGVVRSIRSEAWRPSNRNVASWLSKVGSCVNRHPSSGSLTPTPRASR